MGQKDKERVRQALCHFGFMVSLLLHGLDHGSLLDRNPSLQREIICGKESIRKDRSRKKTIDNFPNLQKKMDLEAAVKSLLVYIQEPVGLTKNQSEKLNHNGSCLGIPWIYNLLSFLSSFGKSMES